MRWAYFSLFILAAYALMGFFMRGSATARGVAQDLALANLLIWYFSAGRAQAKYVEKKFGVGYWHRPWAKTLLAATAALVGYLMFLSVANMLVLASSA